MPRTCVALFIMSHIINLIFLNKGVIDHPGYICNDFINPSTMPYGF
jgi:hypothetical protein